MLVNILRRYLIMGEILMNNEEYKYKIIVEQLKKINKKIQKLDKDVLDLKSLTKKTILVDNQIYNLSRFEKIDKVLINSSNIINKNIIPSLMDKIYK